MNTSPFASISSKYPALIQSIRWSTAIVFATVLFVTLNQSLNYDRRHQVSLILQAAGDDDSKSHVGPLVTVSTGMVRGKTLKSRAGRDFSAFYHLPYAEPPVGEYRFRPPRKLEKGWVGIRDASEVGGSDEECLQIKGSEVGGKEDCLKLSVYTPKLPSDAENPKLPVMFYILGGAFIFGRTNRYGAEYLMDEDVVLVLVDYRYGAFGYLNTEDTEIRGNMAYKDQVMALRWVQENIHKFGGDPKRVLLFGNSSGGASIHAHIISSMNDGLFSRAVSQSGTIVLPPGVKTRPRTTARELGRKLNCSNVEDSKDLHRCLIAADGSAIVTAFAMLPEPMFLTREVVPENGDKSDVFMEGYPMRRLHSGQFKKIPWILGCNSAEAFPKALGLLSNPWIAATVDATWNSVSSQFLHFIDDGEHTQAKRLRNFYFGSKHINNDTRYNLTDCLSDLEWVHPIKRAADYHAKYGGKAFVYLLTKEPIQSYGESSKGDFPPPYGVCHADEVQYFFPMSSFPYISENSPDFQISRTMIKIWTDFARTGEVRLPNGQEWPAVDARDPTLTKWVQLDNEVTLIDPLTERMTFLDDFPVEITEYY